MTKPVALSTLAIAIGSIGLAGCVERLHFCPVEQKSFAGYKARAVGDGGLVSD